MAETTKNVPANACRLVIGDFEFGTNGEDAKTIPVRLNARSPEPIDHPFWGRIVHDMEGMALAKNRLPLDYAHNDGEVVGYLNHFEADDDGLRVSGAIVPFTEDDRASEVVHKHRNGVPYEASINFGGNGIKLEDVEDGEFADVNGYEFAGPGVIVREWPLRGVAICPYGADQNTATELKDGDDGVAVTFLKTKGEETMSAKTKRRRRRKTATTEQPTDDAATELNIATTPEADAEADAATPTDAEVAEVAEVAAPPAPAMPVEDEADAEVAEVADADEDEADADADERGNEYRETQAKPADLRRAEMGAQYRQSFGDDRGAAYFADGLSFEQATTRFVAEITKENDFLTEEVCNLRQRLSAVDRGADAVDFALTAAAEDATGGEVKTLRDIWSKNKNA